MLITIHDCELYSHSRGPKNFNWNISLCLRYNVYSLMESYVIVHRANSNFHISWEARAVLVAINPTFVISKQGSRVEDIKFSFMKVLTKCKVYIGRSFYKWKFLGQSSSIRYSLKKYHGTCTYCLLTQVFTFIDSTNFIITSIVTVCLTKYLHYPGI